MKRSASPNRPRLSVTTGRDLLPVLEQLARADTRTASNMARRLLTEALAQRGLWDLELNQPKASNVVPLRRLWHGE